MRKNIALALLSVAGLTTAASAHSVGLDLKFSNTASEGGTWTSNYAANPGDTVFVRVEMSIPLSFYGISGARYNITSTNTGGWDVGGNDSIDLTPGKGSATDGRIAGFDFGGQTQQVFEATNSLRIDAKGDNNNNPNAGISTSQNTPGALGTNFNTGKNHVTVYKFAVKLSDNPEIGRQIILRIVDTQITSFKGYATSSSSAGDQIAGAQGDSGTITIVPAPGVLGAMGLGAIAAFRRRR
jgi:MYXO-CTERM domain-containing protein